MPSSTLMDLDGRMEEAKQTPPSSPGNGDRRSRRSMASGSKVGRTCFFLGGEANLPHVPHESSPPRDYTRARESCLSDRQGCRVAGVSKAVKFEFDEV